jgi:hypothetical protein
MGEPICQPESTREERLFLALLRHGPQSAAGLAEALQTSVGHSHDVFTGPRPQSRPRAALPLRLSPLWTRGVTAAVELVYV